MREETTPIWGPNLGDSVLLIETQRVERRGQTSRNLVLSDSSIHCQS